MFYNFFWYKFRFYGAGYLFAPKASYTSGKEKEPEREFKDLVKEFHKNDIEVLVELYFTGEESAALAQEAVRFWVYEYHVDGVHLSGFAPAELLASDPLLADTKLLAGSWDGVRVPKTAAASKLRERRWHLGEYNEGFLTDMRRVLKGDEDQVGRLIYQTRRNPDAYGVINYMAATNGFTMMDMVSCEQKHNEANGENNRDGNDYNYTWNCGIEGTTRKRKIVQMRKKQLRNAFLLLFLSQGTPMFLAGDEFGNSQNGNNNAYCQDNEISWLNWHQLETNRDIYEFVKYMIAFRKAHPVFHLPVEPKNIDYLVCGHPDVSYHGVKTWCPEFENFRRQLGILYCGEYGRRADGTSDDYLTGDECPFDLSQDLIDVPDDDFGVWYVDVMDYPDRWAGKTVHMKLLMCHSKKYPGTHCPGRFAMVCCDKDMQFLALVCRGEGLERFKDKEWVEIHATVKKESCDAYQGEGPVLYVSSVTAAAKPANEVVSF